ncbi:MAG TPA: RnfABCDGE type electron transport complex subunit D [Longimicrobiales bacterium]
MSTILDRPLPTDAGDVTEQEEESRLRIAAAPHIKSHVTTAGIMWTVVASMIPIVAASAYFFGVSALLVVAAATLGAVGTEAALGKKGSVADGSAVITGVLLGLCLPPAFPLWMAALGGIFGIAIGKALFGGLGQNPFNPALLGRAFLQGSMPTAITTFTPPGGRFWTVHASNVVWPFMQVPKADAITSATPLGLMKFDRAGTPLLNLVLGSTGGSLGETAGLVILLCGLFLVWKGYVNWRIPLAMLGSAAACATLAHLAGPARYPDALFTIFSGGLMLGAFYMATDYVTAPVTNPGRWIFGAGIGALVVLIRFWGGLPEGVMYAILLGNCMVPFINRATQPRVFGTPGRMDRKEVA